MTLETNIINKFKKNLNINVSLSNYSWFNLGGNAEYFYKAKDKLELIDFLKVAKKKKIKNYYFGCRVKYFI